MRGLRLPGNALGWHLGEHGWAYLAGIVGVLFFLGLFLAAQWTKERGEAGRQERLAWPRERAVVCAFELHELDRSTETAHATRYRVDLELELREASGTRQVAYRGSVGSGEPGASPVGLRERFGVGREIEVGVSPEDAGMLSLEHLGLSP